MANPVITICGRIEIAWDGHRLEGSLPGRQGRLLFAYMLLNRSRAVRRDELVEALWADEGLPSGGDALLSPPLSRLRKVLGPGRIEGRSELTLVLGDEAEVDWEIARETLIDAQRAFTGGEFRDSWEGATEAERILGGGLLPGLEARWIEEHRIELEEARLSALETVARAGARLGGPEQARAERSARAAVEASPFRESARVALIEVMRAQGNVAEALRSYEELRVLLREELGTFPSPELTDLHEQLLNAHETDQSGPTPGRTSESNGTDVSASRAPVTIGRQIDPRMAERAMVGRDEIMEQLREELELAANGELRIALLGGEGGVGKTRLAAELAASREDISVLYGRCEPDEIRPFRVWSGLLRSAIDQIEGFEASDIVGDDGPILARILPELGYRVGLPAPGPAADLESERQALFGAVLRTIGRITAYRPLLMVVDDLHWADRSTLLMLSSLAGDDPPRGMLALGTYRDTELPPESMLMDTLINLQRHRPTIRLRVESLETDDIRRLIEDRVDGDLADVLRDQTAGNPFFIEQVVRHLEETGERFPSAVPDGVREVISQRVARLPEGGPELLRRAALIGREFDLPILLATTSSTEDEVIRLLDEASRSGLLDESPSVAGRYAFVHALLRSTMYEQLGLTRRSRVHRDIGEAIEKAVRGKPDQRPGELAWHFGQAGPAEADRAVLYATRAAEQAESRLAYDEAVVFYDNAIRSARSDEPVDEGTLAKLLLSRAEAEWRIGELQKAGDTFFEAAHAARASGLPDLLARAAVGTCWGSWDAFDADRREQLDLLQEALDAIGPADGPLRAQVLANLAQVLYFGSGVTDRARDLAIEAERLATRLGDPQTEFIVLAATSFRRWEPDNKDLRLSTTDRMVEIAELSADPEDLAEALAWRSVAHINLGRIAEADADQARHAVLNKTLPQISVSTAAMRAARCFLEGSWDEGERITREQLDAGIPKAAAIAIQDAHQFIVLAQQGRLHEHIDRIESMAAESAGWETWPTWRLGLLLAKVHAGRADEVREELKGVDYDGLDGVRQLNITYLSFCTVAALAVAELEDVAAAAKLTDLMEPYAGEWVIFGPAGACMGPVELLLGEMYLVQDRDREAATSLERSLSTCREMGARPYLARTALGLSEALRRLGDPDGPDRSAELFETGHSIALELGMRPVLSRYAR
ncbi:MAG TPA: AAA family ATPase [Solirubrobacterales bacterium]|nr:AAA family ATPase [Solirubrobacterales bacterium]